MSWIMWWSVLVLCLNPVISWARGGGGCLAEGTLVSTPEGPVAIERLKKGDTVWSVAEGRLKRAEVQALTTVNPEEFLEISTSGSRLEVTAEHLLMVGRDEYRLADGIKRGDTVFRTRNGGLESNEVLSVRRMAARRPAYNLLVSPGGTFVTEGLVVHNKGCFLPDSHILRPDGTETPISALSPGDALLAFRPGGRMVQTRVREILRLEVDEYFLLKTDRATLRVTAEHPFYVGHGTFKTVEALKEGDTVFTWDGKWLAEQRIVSLQKVHQRVEVFNLQTDHPNTFFAGQLAVHNKGGGGGCFPAGTKIATPRGPVSIETLASGDEVFAVDGAGRTVQTVVKVLFVSKSPVTKVRVGEGVLAVTEEHPLAIERGRFRQAGELQPGNRILRWKDGRLVERKVHGISHSVGDELVFNLQVDGPNTFIADGIVVHNKGGGGSSSSSSRSSSGGGGSGDGIWVVFVVLGLFVFVFVIIIIGAIKGRKGTSKTENLDFVYGRNKVSPKAGKTEKLLIFLAQQDPSVKPEVLRKLVDSTFRKLQECWQARSYEPMKPLLMPDLYNQHTAQLSRMIANHEIDRIEDLKVEYVDLVNVRYTEKPDQREFTALITASARDYYVDDKTGKFLRGDKAPARFQEFWTFHRVGDGWLLREVEQAGESDVLKDENFVEMLTDDTVKGVYGEVAKKKGDAGPWLEKETEEKATRIERLLNFLVQTDKLWNRNQMLERAREVFMKVYLARESGDPDRLPATDLFPQVTDHLRLQIQQWKKGGRRVEYRNLCVRKAELLLVRNFADNSKDEYTVRISAHAQRIFYEGDKVRDQQEYVTPFEEYWTFGRLDHQWKLKEVLPPGAGKKIITRENVDEESSAGQMEWYYRQSRAK